MSKESDEVEICNEFVKHFFELNKGATQSEVGAVLFGAKCALQYAAKQQAERDAKINCLISNWLSDEIQADSVLCKISDIMEGKS